MSVTKSLSLSEDQELWAEKLAMVGELAAGMAHEIRNPLTSIRGFLQLLQRKFPPQAAEQEYFNIIFAELDRINNLIKEFLSLSKPIEPRLEMVDYTRLMEEALLLASQEALLYEVELKERIEKELPPLCLDPSKIKQTVLNILVNAIQAVGPGGKVEVEI